MIEESNKEQTFLAYHVDTSFAQYLKKHTQTTPKPQSNLNKLENDRGRYSIFSKFKKQKFNVFTVRRIQTDFSKNITLNTYKRNKADKQLEKYLSSLASKEVQMKIRFKDWFCISKQLTFKLMKIFSDGKCMVNIYPLTLLVFI